MGAGDTVTITATVNQNVGLTHGRYAIHIYEGITGTLIKTCTSGTVCTATDKFYTNRDPNWIPYDYFATVAPLGVPASGIWEDNGLGDYMVISNWQRVERKPWTVKVEKVSNSQFRVTLNQDIGKTGGRYGLYMFDWIIDVPGLGYEKAGACLSGKVCLFTVPGGYISRSYGFWVAPRLTYSDEASCCVFGQGGYTHPPATAPAGPQLARETVGGSNPSEKPCQCGHADPVNTATGEFYLPAADLTLSGVGPGLTLSRTYSTLNADSDGLFGYGWVSNLNANLQVVIAASGSDPLPRQVEITQENGATVLFTKSGSVYVGPSRVLADLVYDSVTQQWTLTRKSGQTLVFDSLGRLSTVADQYGNTLNLTRNSIGQVILLTGSAGRSITLTWSGARVVGAIDSAGRTATYEYDPEGNLVTVVGPEGGVSRYTYDADHFMMTLNEPGDAVTSNVYDTAGRLIEQTDPISRVTTFSYSGGTTTITAPDGSQIVEVYSDGLLTSQTRGAGTDLASTTAFTYDEKLNIKSVTDPIGGVTVFTYDAHGNTLSKTDALGSTSYWTYDTDGHQTSFTDGLGRESTATYDANGQIATSTSPGGRVTSWTYNTDGTTASMTTPGGAVSIFAYDAAGRLISTADAEGRTTTFAYDAAGNPITTTGPDGQSATSEFDDLGRLVSVTDPLGHTTTYGYDAAGYGTSVTDPTEATISSIFDVAGQLLSLTDGEGKVTLYSYTSAGQVESITDANSNIVSSEYDVLGQVTSTTDANGKTTQYSYNDIGWRTSTTLPSGAVTSVVYDGVGRAVSVTDPTNGVTVYAYDAAGQTASVTDPLGRVTTFSYTVDGQQSQVTFADASVVLYTYTLDGKLASFTNADGKVTTYTYNLAGQPTSKTEPGGLTTAFAFDVAGRIETATLPDLSTVAYGYDLAGRLISSHSSAVGSTDTGYTYDAAGRPTQIVDATGTSSFDYDAVGRLVAEVDGGGAAVGYGYDDVGQLVGLTYPSGHEVTYQYDPAGHLSSLTDWLSATTDFTYTDDGQLATETRPNGTVHSTAYDAAGRLASLGIAGPGGSLATFGYTYDLAGQLVGSAATGGAGAIDYSYAYDQISQLSSVETTAAGSPSSTALLDATPAGSLTVSEQGAALSYNTSQQLTAIVPLMGDPVTVAYDGRGSRISATSASSSSTYTYSANSALETAVTAAGTVAYTTDARGLRQSRDDGTTSSDFVWSSAGSLPLLLTDGGHEYIYGASSTPLAQVDTTTGVFEYLGTDIIGSVRTITDDTGALVGANTFSAFGNRTVHTGTSDSAFGFTGNWTDAATGFVYLRARDYDPATGQFLTVDPALEDTRQPYAYTGNSPLLRTDPTGMDWFSDILATASRELKSFARDAAPVLANLGAAALGFADEMTGGASTALLRAINPDVDCFIDAHKDAFGAGQVVGVITTVVVAVASIVVTAGAATGAVVAGVAVKMAVKKSLKEALVVGVKRNVDEVAAAATRSPVATRAAVRTSVEDAATSCKNSFTADTPVAMADGSSRPISEVEVGDEVVATDPESGETASRPVAALIRHGGQHTMVDVALEDGSQVTATDGHPFWDVSTGTFTDAVDLEAGELVLALDGSMLRIDSVRVHGEDLIAYNLEIEGIHTYYVGITPVLVHNSCDVNLASEARTTHILQGDVTGGGHQWPGRSGKTPFAWNWSGDDVMNAISDVVTNPSSVNGATSGGRTSIYGNFNGVLIKVVTDWSDIITAHPVVWGR